MKCYGQYFLFLPTQLLPRCIHEPITDAMPMKTNKRFFFSLNRYENVIVIVIHFNVFVWMIVLSMKNDLQNSQIAKYQWRFSSKESMNVAFSHLTKIQIKIMPK